MSSVRTRYFGGSLSVDATGGVKSTSLTLTEAGKITGVVVTPDTEGTADTFAVDLLTAGNGVIEGIAAGVPNLGANVPVGLPVAGVPALAGQKLRFNYTNTSGTEKTLGLLYRLVVEV